MYKLKVFFLKFIIMLIESCEVYYRESTYLSYFPSEGGNNSVLFNGWLLDQYLILNNMLLALIMVKRSYYFRKL